MKVLMDTSTLIAAMLPDQVHHAGSQVWLSKAKARVFDFFVSGHSLAEIYAVLTRLPRLPRFSPNEALQLVQDNVSSVATVVTLAGNDYISLIERLVPLKISGGAVYDGVIAKAAELAKVDYLLTLNVAHFHQVWPSGSNRLASPQSFSPP